MAVLYFDPSTLNLPAVGETFNIDVKIRDAVDLDAFRISVNNDASILEYVSISNAIEDVDISVRDRTVAGQAAKRFSFTGIPSSPSGDLRLFTLTYRVVDRQAHTLMFLGLGSQTRLMGMDGTLNFTVESATLQAGSLTPITLKSLSYSGHPLALTVKIHDQVIPNAITAVDDILSGVDYPNLTEFRVGEASITLRDVPGDFSPNNPSNFFTQHGGQRTGRNSPIEIEAGFIGEGTRHTATIFKGTIIRLVQGAKDATVKVVCTDNFGDMRKKTIADFGVSRHFMLVENTEQSGANGNYPIMDAVMPAADGSVSLATRTGETLKPVQKLETEGTLNPRNFIVDAAGVRTEGGLIVDRQVGYPQIRMKSPFRYRHIEDIITDILNHAGISDSEIEIPEQDVDSHFSSNGRVNYDLLGNIGSSNPLTWNGYVTDFLFETDKWYFLYNKHRNNPNGISQVIEYDETTRTYTQLHKFAAAVEVWKFTKVGNTFYILASTGGNYDANEISSENKIIQLDIGSSTETVFVPRTAALQPQLAHYYAGVGSVHHKPDSRRQLIYHGNGLYYAYVDRANSQFGVAKAINANTAPTAIITMNMDTYENHSGLGFDIDASGMLKGGLTFLNGGRTQVLVFKKAL